MSEIPDELDALNLPEPTPSPTEPAPEQPIPNHRAGTLFGGRRPAGDRGTDRPRRERKQRPLREVPPLPRGGLVKPLTDLYTGVGTMVYAFDPICGQAVIQAAPECAKALNDLAKQNDAVRRVLVQFLETSAWGLVMVAHAPILIAVAMHHVPALQNVMGAMGQETADEAEQYLQGNTE